MGVCREDCEGREEGGRGEVYKVEDIKTLSMA